MSQRWPHVSNAVGEQILTISPEDIPRGIVKCILYIMFLIQGKFLTQLHHCIYAT